MVSLVLLVLGLPVRAEFYSDWAAAHFADLPAQSGALDDPDHDGQANLLEFTFGTDPRVGDGSILGQFIPRTNGADGTIVVDVLEQQGHRPGVQLDLQLSADLQTWFTPWWQRTLAAALPTDPVGAVRERFTTVLVPKKLWFVRGRVRLLETGPTTATVPASAKTYYVAPGGSDGNPGTLALPYATLNKPTGLANPGDLIYVRGGTYACTARVYISRSGSAVYPISVRAYPCEQPVLDFTSMTNVNLYGISIAGSYWHLCGLEVFNAPGLGIRMVGHDSNNPAGSYNVIERCVARECRDSGFAIGESTLRTNLPGNNLILNCDSIRSYDAVTHGENADGFRASFNIGPGNVFRGCRSWENSDDGWDLWMGIAPVLIENCWSFGNGQNLWGDTAFTGNGNGFKLGGNGVPAAHRLVRSLAFYNVGTGGRGIDQNNNTAALTVDQNTSWGNRTANINLNISPAPKNQAHVVRNNLVIGGTVTFNNYSILTGNSWQVFPAGVTTADFLYMNTDTDTATVALITSYLTAPRRDDGSLPELPLARPAPNGRLVDAGAVFDDGGYLGYANAFQGAAPDPGAFETPFW